MPAFILIPKQPIFEPFSYYPCPNLTAAARSYFLLHCNELLR